MKFISTLKNLNTQSYVFKPNSGIAQNFFRCLSQDSEITTHEITIKSCGNVYEKWKKIEKYKNLPNSDLTFNIKYLDTYKDSKHTISEEAPVVVALHGAPGSCTEFLSLAGFLRSNGVRVLVPTFPDFSVFHPGIFRHTDEEKAQYVKDFLSAVSVSKVDLLVCHSSAVFPSLLLCLDQNPIVKSIAMLNPATFSLKQPAIKNYSVLKLIVKASEKPFFLKVLETVGPLLLKLAKVPVRTDNFLDPLLSATVMARPDVSKSKEKYHQLASAGFPIFYAFSKDDKLIGEQSASELASFLGAKSSDICFVNKDGAIQEEGHETPNLKVMCFENGSHYVFLKYSHVINPAIYAFLKQQVTGGVQS